MVLYIFAVAILLSFASRTVAQQQSCVPLNVCFSIDESGSISSTQFQQQTDAVIAIANSLIAFAPGSTFSGVGFSSTASVIVPPTQDISGTFIPAIEANPQDGRATSSGSGLLLCEQQLNGASDPRVIVLLTDGMDNRTPFGVDVADDLKNDGIFIATVGVGPAVNNTDLEMIASGPEFSTFVTGFGTLQTSVEAIVLSLCPSPTPTRSPTPTPIPSTTPTPTPSVTPTPSTSPAPERVNVDCAKCGQVLECYVNSGFDEVDSAVCDVILNKSQFCPVRGGRFTKCGQQCRGRQGLKCFPGESWGTCPAVIGSNGGAAKCKGGAGKGRPADLSNFASYTVMVGRDGTTGVSCLIDKCDSGTCPCADPLT